MPSALCRRLMAGGQLRINSRQSPAPRSPRQFQKNSFRLIIKCVPGCNLVHLAAQKRSSEKFVSQLPRGSLHTKLLFRRACPDISALANELQFMSGRQLAHELLIRVRFRASQSVIEMNDRKHDPDFSTQLQKNPQQRDRICAARNGNAHALSRPQQIMLANVVEHRLRELVHSSMVIPAEWAGHLSSCGSDIPVRLLTPNHSRKHIRGCPTLVALSATGWGI